jgi:hypothetical protein
MSGSPANGCSVYAPPMPRSRRTPHRGELAGLAERLENLSDDFAGKDQALSLKLAAASVQLRRHLEETRPDGSGLWQ